MTVLHFIISHIPKLLLYGNTYVRVQGCVNKNNITVCAEAESRKPRTDLS